MYCYYKCSRPFLAVLWVVMQYVIVIFPDHTHISFTVYLRPVFLAGCDKFHFAISKIVFQNFISHVVDG